jgi:oligogalacturonide transporter
MNKNKKSENYDKSWIYQERKINVGRGVAYGLTDLMGGGWNNIVSGIIFTFVLSNGVSPALAGAITGIGRIVDALSSLFIGSITDNFHKTALGRRFGRRHFIFGVGILAFAIVFPLFWFSTDNWLYYLFVYCVIEIIIAFILIAWETLPTEMTNDYKARTILSGSRMVISATGTSFVFFTLFVLKSLNNPNAYLIAGIIYTIVFVIGMVLSWRLTWERPLTKEVLAELDAEPKLSIKKIIADYFSTFRNKAFRKHLAVYIFSFTGKDFFQTLLPTFVVYSLAMRDSDPWLINALAFVGIFMSIFAAWLMIKTGPKFLYTISYSVILLVLVIFLVIGLSDNYNRAFILPILICVAIFWHLARAILEFTPWNVFPFIPDIDYIMTRESRAGIYAAVMTFFRKSTGAIAAWIAGFMLEIIRFVPAPAKICSLDKNINNLVHKTEFTCVHAGGKWVAPNSDQVHAFVTDMSIHQPNIGHEMTLAMVIGTAVFIAIALIIARSFRLNQHTHELLKLEIDRLEKGGFKEDVRDKTRRVVEQLTGHPYSECWPDKAESKSTETEEAQR